MSKLPFNRQRYKVKLHTYKKHKQIDNSLLLERNNKKAATILRKKIKKNKIQRYV